MDELEEIRKRRLIELQKQQEEEMQEQQQLQAQVEQLEIMLRQFLSKEALQRYGNLKAAHREKALQLLVILGQAIQQGNIKEKITDEQLRDILKRMSPKKRDITITRK
ncbi:hypothetical protein KY366_06200 [Candidatus Woesearchaeota archaeon]|nr:hypothetical protein [Candidatus Woesearchaeota archaeon]